MSELVNLILVLTIVAWRIPVFAQIIETSVGRLQGLKIKSENGRDVFAFRAIPFSEPPVGELRFQPPRPKKCWEEILNATQHGPHCAQAALGSDAGEEDCLHISVYTPRIPATGNLEMSLPVLVWIPGGAFVSGGAEDYDPYLMMNRNIVFVVPQYRLGMLGYFTTRSPYASGNYGSLDQVLALKWVRDNIAAFGGDPQRITLGGDCAGGVSAILHMTSPLTNGLFHRVISFSGSPLSPWAIQPKHNRLSIMIANFVKCPSYDPYLLTKCFKELSVKELLDAQQSYLEARDLFVGNGNLGPTIQTPADVQKSALFLGEHPLKLLLSGKFSRVPILLEVTRDVGSYIVDMGFFEFILFKMEENSDFLKLLVEMIVKESGIRNYEKEKTKFEEFYLPNWDRVTLGDAISGITEMLGDTLYNAGILFAAKILSQYVPTRMLRFDYEGGPKLFNLRHPDPEIAPPIPSSSISHGDELFSFLPYQPYAMSSEQKKVVNTMLDILEDFIYGRDHKLEWQVFSKKELETAVITERGNFIDKVRFVTKEKEEMLRYIFQSHHRNILQEVKKEENNYISEWIHDEL